MKYVRLIILAMLLQPTAALARSDGDSFFINPAAFYLSRTDKLKDNNIEVEGKSSTTYFNLNAGYTFGQGLILGIKYYDEKTNYDIDDATTKESVTGWGPAIGWNFGQFKAVAGLLVVEGPKKKVNDDFSTVYSDGDGVIYDVMYHFDVGEVGIGPQLSLVTMKYKKKEVNGVEDDNFKSLEESLLLPSVSLFMSF